MTAESRKTTAAAGLRLEFRLALRYLGQRKLRSSLCALAVALGVMLTFGLGGFIPALEDAFRQNLMAAAGQVDLTVTSETRGTFDPSVADIVRSVPGVAHVTGSLVRPVVLAPGQAPLTSSGRPLGTIILDGLDPATVTGVRAFHLAAGRTLAAGDGYVALISDRLARDTGLGLGSVLHLPSAAGQADFQVVGILVAGPSLGTEEVFVPLAAAQEVLGLSGRINTVEALLSPGADRTATGRAVLERLGPGYKLGGNEVGGEMASVLRMSRATFWLIGLLALLMGGFIIYNTFRTSIAERRRDVGLLRALGASRRAVLGLVLAESILQGLTGTAVGLAAGYGLVAGMLAWAGPLFEQLMHLSLGRPIVTAGNVAAAVGLGLGVSILGGMSPALAASRIPPLEAMRPVTPEQKARTNRRRLGWGAALTLAALAGLGSGNLGLATVGVVLFVTALLTAGPLLVEPVTRVFGRLLGLVFAREGRVAEANLIRQPDRAAVTASAVMIGLAIFVALAGLGSSLGPGLAGYIDSTLGRADFLVLPQSLVLGGGNVGAGPELLAAVRALPGVDAATSLRLATTRVEPDIDLQVIGIDPAAYPALGGLAFAKGDPAEAYKALAAGRNIICNSIFAAQARVGVGDDLTLATPGGPRVYHVVGVASDILNAKLATAYVSQADLGRDFGETGDLLVLVGMAKGADRDTVRDGLEKIVRAYPAFTLFATEEWKKTMLDQVTSSMSLIYAIMLLMAVPSLVALVNTLGIAVLERTREIGVLRAVGATRRQVGRIVVAESLLLAAAGTAWGLLAGLWLGYILVGAIAALGFPLPYSFPYAATVATVAAGLLLGVLGALIPAGQASRVKVTAALRYE